MELAVIADTLDASASSPAQTGAEPPRDEALAALVTAAQRGERNAFEKLYERYYRMVHGVALARVRFHEAQDVVQEVFLIAMRRIQTLREPGGFGAWLAAIARNIAHEITRRQRAAASISENVESRPDTRIAAFETLELIRSLPEAYRETLILRFVEGLTGPEIAAQTGLTPASVRVNLHRGYCLLRERLARESSP